MDTATVTADGKINKINFNYTPDRSCWAAIRVFRSSHSNPIFILVDGKPIHEKRSAEWCRQAVDQCWKTKSPNMRAADKADAQVAYDKARMIYDTIINEAENN